MEPSVKENFYLPLWIQSLVNTLKLKNKFYWGFQNFQFQFTSHTQDSHIICKSCSSNVFMPFTCDNFLIVCPLQYPPPARQLAEVSASTGSQTVGAGPVHRIYSWVYLHSHSSLFSFKVEIQTGMERVDSFILKC